MLQTGGWCRAAALLRSPPNAMLQTGDWCRPALPGGKNRPATLTAAVYSAARESRRTQPPTGAGR
ncbi:MAG: hypothetical protein E7047_00105 [Lentisphaerae bacterium]|nr:hypothetical protein [Lentisphaerota bacterium]